MTDTELDMEMTKLRKDYQNISEAPIYRPVSITICTSAPKSNVRGFMDELACELEEKVKEVRYQQLPYSDVEKFSFKDKTVDAMILCHSINNRRFAVTDVTDALYTKFLPKMAQELGKHKVGVVVHDMALEKIMNDVKFEEEMSSFRRQQPTTFKNASMVLIGGQLGSSPTQLGPGNWTDIKDFVSRASRFSEDPPEKALRKLFLPAVVIFAIIIGLAIGLGVGLS